MKKKVSLCFSIFFLMGAVVLFTGPIQANAEQVSNLWSGTWSCATTSDDGITYDGGRNITRHKIISDGISYTDHTHVRPGEQWGFSVYTQGGITGTAREDLDHSMTMSYTYTFTDPQGALHVERYMYECNGSSLKDPQDGYHQADCIIAVSVGYPTPSWNVVVQRAQCKRTDQQIE